MTLEFITSYVPMKLYLKKILIKYFLKFIKNQIKLKNIFYLKEILEGLSCRGHRLINFGHGGSAVQAISRQNDGSLQAVCDGRKGGIPDGF